MKNVRFLAASMLGIVFLFFTASLYANEFVMTPAIQSQLDKQKALIATWAANPIIEHAVEKQNQIGPIPGMDKAKWKLIRRSDPLITEFQTNAAGQYLKSMQAKSKLAISEAFLSADKGEKVAFIEKTSSYIHQGQAKFDVPFTTGKAWQGKPEFDESTQTYALQIAVPVLSAGKPIGVLVVGINLSQLEKLAN
ncbi:cache domain-containing protein [Deefgea piscis]|uniref:Cache domain-containing protein n=1 Tax=Deefgea piscis TaxID=2739061 RepID=A0A6M8SL44_9NEIS|nr:cache domain-containing protein [Deefgea piscis]QKJ65371.1 cache domain-containing protein [Deefgea piscis]